MLLHIIKKNKTKKLIKIKLKVKHAKELAAKKMEEEEKKNKINKIMQKELIFCNYLDLTNKIVMKMMMIMKV